MMSRLGYIFFYLALFGLGSLCSIGVPFGIMIYQAWKGRNRKRVAVPIVLRMLNDDRDNFDELIGIPHDMVVGFLEATFHVKIVTKKNKPRPPDKDLLKWVVRHAKRDDGQPMGGRYTQDLTAKLKEYIPFAIHRPKENIGEVLRKLEKREQQQRLKKLGKN